MNLDADFVAMWKELGGSLNERLVPTAERVFKWFVERGLSIKLGGDGFIPQPLEEDRNQTLLKVNLDGQFQIRFQDLARRPPFSAEALRKELFDRVNRIDTAVDLPPHKWKNGKPTFDLMVLNDPSAWRNWIDVMDWLL